MFKKIEAAKNLGMKDADILKLLRQRLGKSEAGRVWNNRGNPFKVPSFVKKTIIENAAIRNQPNPLSLLNKLWSDIFVNYRQEKLFENPENLFENIINLREEDRTPNVTQESFKDAYQSSDNKIAPNVSETVEQVDVSSIPSGTLRPSDTSQLAKSGNIDITEAIAARRT